MSTSRSLEDVRSTLGTNGSIGERPDGSSDFTGALLRPHADCMTEIMKIKGRKLVDGVFQATKEAFESAKL